MKTVRKAFLLLFTSGILCGGCAKKPQQHGLTLQEGVLSVGVEIGYPPMEYYDTDGKTLIGFDIDLAKALADTLGLRVDFIDVAWEGILPGLDADRYDIAVNITILPERQNNYNFTKPYIDSSITIVALKGSGFIIEKPEDIAGHSVCYQGDTTAHYFTERLSAQGADFTSYSYDKILNCFDDLALGRVDLLVADNIAAFNYAGKENSPFEVVWQGPSDEYIGICLKKGNDALTDALNKALDELFENGTMLIISQKIFGHM
ncbi:MAG: transporter substrate-binding domain-containing protein [Treponema sp.]|jgi:polar amino acid transport system substrate-binding protein|nr:transporter substrate-binding domain-containing protein [Treponema sp.]